MKSKKLNRTTKNNNTMMTTMRTMAVMTMTTMMMTIDADDEIRKTATTTTTTTTITTTTQTTTTTIIQLYDRDDSDDVKRDYWLEQRWIWCLVLNVAVVPGDFIDFVSVVDVLLPSWNSGSDEERCTSRVLSFLVERGAYFLGTIYIAW